MLKDKSILKEKKIDAEEFAKILSNLSEEDKEKIFYMVKGIELVSDSKNMLMAAGI